MSRASLGILGRVLLAALGVSAIAALVADAGTGTTLATLVGAWPWLPLIALGELAFVATDLVALRALHGPGVPRRRWLRGAALAYAATAFLPAGRVAGELARAAELAPHLGAPRAVAGATVLQGTFLWASALIAIPCWAAVATASSSSSPLALLVAGSAAFHATLGTVLAVGPRWTRLWGRLGARVGLGAKGADFERALRAIPVVPLTPIAAALAARTIQVAQCAVLVLAAGGSVDLGGALVVDAIQLVAASVGDAVPGQAGVVEGAYAMLAPGLGVSSSIAHALAIALLLRVCRVGLGATAALAALALRSW